MNRMTLDIGFSQIPKYKQAACGDSFQSYKSPGEQQVLAVLADGLGSGIKAGVLSTLTTVMALKAMVNQNSPETTAQLIYKTLPVCSERKIAYSTLTIVEIRRKSQVKIIEYENPRSLIFSGIPEDVDSKEIVYRRIPAQLGSREAVLMEKCFEASVGDRIIFFSDGVSQSGLGTKRFPLGWDALDMQKRIQRILKQNPEISAGDLANAITHVSLQNDGLEAKDDISCGVIYFRHPRDLILVTGPPFDPDRDSDLARDISLFNGHKILCGGTTASIVAREWHRSIQVKLETARDALPPESVIDGVDLVTEGILTLARVVEILKHGNYPDILKENNPAGKIIAYLMNSDRIHFWVGTRINEAHQDPKMPVELEIRRNVIKKMARILEQKFLKQVEITYF